MNVVHTALLLTALAAFAGCSPPNAANIVLRKQVQAQQDEIATLKRQVAVTTMPTTGLADRPSLTPGQTESLVTVRGIQLGRLTGLDGQDLTIHVVPTDVDGDPIKAAGTISVDAFDLTDNGHAVGHWAFDAKRTQALWNGTALRYEYVVPCPLGETPQRELTVKVTFVDALTGRTFSQQISVNAQRS